MTCECCHFDPIVKALSAILKTYSVLQKSPSTARCSAKVQELDPIAIKISREQSKKKPKQKVLKALKQLHPKFKELVELAKQIVESPDGQSPSLAQQICLACSESSNDDNLSNSGQTFVSIDAMSYAALAKSGEDPAAPVDQLLANDEQDDHHQPLDPSQDLEDPATYDDAATQLTNSSHDYLNSHSLLSPIDPLHSDPQPTSALPTHIHDLLVKYLNDFRSLETDEQILILHQWAGGSFSDFATMKWIPPLLKKTQSKQLISQHWAKIVAKFPLAAALQKSKALKPVTNSLAQHYVDDNHEQLELGLPIPKS